MQSRIGRAVRLGVSSLLLHKLRSALTTLGVLFGVSSVIAMLAIAEGGSEEAQAQIRELGSQNVILRSIKPPEEVQNSNQQTRVSSYGLKHADLARIEDTIPGVSEVIAVRQLQQEVRLGTRAATPRVLATVPSYISVTGRELWAGRFLTEEDQRTVNNVCVLSYETARQLLPFKEPIGERIRVGANYFICVGVLMPRVPIAEDQPKPGEEAMGEVILPMSTAHKWYGNVQVKVRAGSRDMEEVELHEIIIAVGVPENVPFVAAAVREMLSQNHKKRDYEPIVPLELLMKAAATKRIFNIVLGSIAGISLLVGGIGIMNVMLATVTERTREIGVRRALGAKRRHIVTQFLVETVVLSVGGGLAGILLGLAIPLVIEEFTDMKTIVTPMAPVLAFGISAGIGVVFGLYPAWRASQMDPVEALRHE